MGNTFKNMGHLKAVSELEAVLVAVAMPRDLNNIFKIPFRFY